ncbi:MAG TPA: hypothetical protein VFB80_14605 [Pirellulaceae bacterium]|nr:hypothetical protein [Pirellulaceae bacterium]
MNVASSAVNPYASPLAQSRGEPEFSPVEFSAQLLSRGWMRRRFAVSGPCPCIVDYNGRGIGYESVLVNGALAVRIHGDWRKLSDWIWLQPRLDFDLFGSTMRKRACIEARGILRLSAFRLTVDGKVLYSEGTW